MIFEIFCSSRHPILKVDTKLLGMITAEILKPKIKILGTKWTFLAINV